jgi:hypothetical protein
MEDRKITLLKACKDLLKQCESTYALDILMMEVFYDGTYCDALCLLDDIEALLAELES